MSRSYYEMRDAKVRIAHELMNRGWEVLGYKADESDSMTDYYNPANWGGIATKNGFVLVVDNSTAGERKEIKKYNYGSGLSVADKNKIEKLQAMTTERGASAGEEENAKRMIEKIKANTSDLPEFEIVGYTVAHMANPSTSKWHLEKDGALYGKGTGLTKYSDLPNDWQFDINTMTFKSGYEYYSTWENGEYVRAERTITDEQRKVINDFKALILKWERIVNNMNTMGDGTKETEIKANEQQAEEKLVKVTVKETKKVIKPVPVERKMVQVGDFLKVRNYVCYWKVISINEERKTFTYEQVGKKYQDLKNGKRYYDYMKNLDKEGQYTICELKEVKETIEVEKWIKVEQKKEVKKETAKAETVKEEVKETANSTITETNSSIGEFTIIEDTDTRDNTKLWIVKLVNRVDKEEFNRIHSIIKSMGGYYSRFKGGFIFKNNPSENLGVVSEQKEEAQEVAVEQQENNNSIDLNNINYENVEVTEADKQTARTIEDYSVMIIDINGLYKMEWLTSEIYKTELIKIIKSKQIKLTLGVLKYLSVECENLERVLINLLQNEAIFLNVENSYNSNVKTVDESKINNYEQESIEEGYIYNCHFKEWNMSIEDIKAELTYNSINFIDYGCKVGFENLDYDAILIVKNLSDRNESILFIDSKILECKNSYNSEPITDQEDSNIINMNNYKEDKKEIEQEEEKETMNIFDKFDNIKIENTDRINPEDNNFCITQQEHYKKAITPILNCLNELKEVTGTDMFADRNWNHNSNNNFLDWYRMGDIKKVAEDIKEKFINKIVYYFKEKYNVTIKDEFKKKYDFNIKYEEIIEEIFDQLGGFTFTEKEETEIKEKLKENTKSYREDGEKVKVNKSKININSFVGIDTWDVKWGGVPKINYNYESTLTDLIKGLKHFSEGTTSLTKEEYTFIREDLRNKIGDYKELNFRKIDNIKIFKNGKLEINFKNSQDAQQFAREYLTLSKIA